MDIVVVKGIKTPAEDGYAVWLLTTVTPSKYSNLFLVDQENHHNSCREYFTKYLREYINKRNKTTGRMYYVVIGGNFSKFDDRLVPQRAHFNDAVKRGVALTNAFEKECGWPLTIIKPARMEQDLKNAIPIWLVSASHRWIRSPYLVSLHTLMMRAGKTYNVTKNIKDFYFEERRTSENLTSDTAQVKRTVAYWEVMMRNYQHLFGKYSLNYNWALARIPKHIESASSLRAEGLYKLLNDGHPLNKPLQDEIFKIVKEKGNPYTEKISKV